MSSEVCHCLKMKKKEFCLRGRIFTNEDLEEEAERALQDECTAQNTLSEAEVEMHKKLGKKKF